MLLLLLTGSTAACKKYLDAPPDSGVSPVTVVDYSKVLNGEGWSKAIPPTDGGPLLFFLDMMTDDTDEKASGGLADDKLNYSAFYTWQNRYDALNDEKRTPSGLLNDTWLGLYRIIQACNIILDAANTMKGDLQEKKFLLGEAYFSRALAYYFLVNIWGRPYAPATPDDPMGVPVKTGSNIAIAGFPRQSVGAVYQLILDDMAAAEKNVTAVGITKNIFHYSPAAIYLLLSRVHLYMQHWAQAAAYADKCLRMQPALYDITGKGLSIVQPLTQFFVQANPEIIYTFNNTAPDALTTVFGYPSDYCFRAAPDLLQRYDTGDQRLSAFFMGASVNDTVLFPKTFDGYGPKGPYFSYCFRTAEAYLNRAEANARLGNLTAALADLNLLRQHRVKASVPISIADKDQLLAQVLLERRKELPFQLHRWFDLRRTGQPALIHYYTPVVMNKVLPVEKFALKKNDPGYTLEIPAKALASDPALQALGLPLRQKE